MLLLIDAGNTRIKWAVLPPHRARPTWHATVGVEAGWLASGAVSHHALETLADCWRGRDITKVIIANVAGGAIHTRLTVMLQSCLAVPPDAVCWFKSTESAAGLHNGYRLPAQLGCDRFAALIGARTLFASQALIVAGCGTATTIDAVSVEGNFIGGMILPGLTLMSSALARHAAQLPAIGATAETPPMFATDTDSAIASGCLQAQVGAIERACARHAGALCLLTGGAAARVAAALTMPHRSIDNLVLLGLQAAATFESLC